jgi:hypothetical protein
MTAPPLPPWGWKGNRRKRGGLDNAGTGRETESEKKKKIETRTPREERGRRTMPDRVRFQLSSVSWA